MDRLNIVGAGRVGQTLGKLLADANLVEIAQVKNRTIDSAERAVEFIGAGHPVLPHTPLAPAELTLIATSDGAIAQSVDQLVKENAVPSGSVVFHCSGATPAEILAPARGVGAVVGCVHPTKSFADPMRASQTFKGTYCGFDGDLGALNRLGSLFESLGAHIFSIRSDKKAHYHLAAVTVSNYVTTLIDCAIEQYGAAGVDEALARKIIDPLIADASRLALRLGCSDALTGPISRGDYQTIENHLVALRENAEVSAIYRALGVPATDIALRQGIGDRAAIARIRHALSVDDAER